MTRTILQIVPRLNSGGAETTTLEMAGGYCAAWLGLFGREPWRAIG